MGSQDKDFQYKHYAGDDNGNSQRIIKQLLKSGLTGDKYEMHEEISHGGMGIIYRANDLGLKRTTVLKVIQKDQANSDIYNRFIEEARITGQLEHPNIIPVHDLGVINREQIYFSMKFIEGEELNDIIDALYAGDPNYEEYTLFRLLTIFRKVCDATAFAHSKGIIHRDIKPENIMVGDYGEVLLVDWGLAKREKDYEAPEPTRPKRSFFSRREAVMSPKKTRFGVIKGTPAFMAPEQAQGLSDKIDKRSDIFLLGATLYSLTTYMAPFDLDDECESEDDIYRIMERAENCIFTKPSQRNPKVRVSQELEEIILKAMAKNPDDRYQSVEDLSKDIDQLLEGSIQSTKRTFKESEMLVKENEFGDEAFVIISGSAEVYKNIDGKRISLGYMVEGDCIGEMAILDNAPRSASVIAAEDTEVIVITNETMKNGLKKLPDWLAKIMLTMTDRLRSASDNIHPLFRKDPSYHVLNQFKLLFPYCGEISATDDGHIYMIHSKNVENDISKQLCIPESYVSKVFDRLKGTNLLRIIDEDHIEIPNFEAFSNFVDFVGVKTAQTEINSKSPARIFNNNNELIMSFKHVNSDTESPSEKISPYPCPSTEELLDCDNSEITAKFNAYLRYIQTGKY